MDKAVPSLGADSDTSLYLAYQPAPAARRIHYERRRPEDTVLYQVVQEHLETFLAQVEAETRSALPAFVQAELDAFLQCGILAHGFLRLRCGDCAHEKLVAFSCKRRGFCPSCGARRMVETAAHLVDHVIPRVPVRQWVVSFPIPLRLLFAAHPEVLTPVLQIVHRVIATFLIKQSGLKRADAATGAVTLIQRFGSAANLNIHSHCLVLDGVYCTTGEAPVFHPVRAPTAGELQTLLNQIIRRLMRLLTRQGYLVEEQGMTYLADPDPDNALAPLQAAACTYRIAFGPRAGQKVLSLHTVPPKRRRLPPSAVSATRALASMPRCAAPPISATNSSICVATLLDPSLLTSGLNAIAPAMCCCSSRRPTKTAPRIL